MQVTHQGAVFQSVRSGVGFMNKVPERRGAFVGHAVDELPSAGRIVSHPRNVKPSGLAVNIRFPADLVLKLRVLPLLYVVENLMDVLVPCGSPGGRRAGQGQVEIHFSVPQPLADLRVTHTWIS